MKKSVPLIIGNWKQNPATVLEAERLAAGIRSAVAKHAKNERVYLGLAPSLLHLLVVHKKLGSAPIMRGAQTLSTHAGGAHTGEVSAVQLRDTGVDFAIIGHSERRAAGETDAQVAEQVAVALRHKIIPVVCVGEKTRDQKGAFYEMIKAQLAAIVTDLPSSGVKKLVIAYEPIWAIGTGKTASAADVVDMSAHIRQTLAELTDDKTARAVRLLYGGSVKPHNAYALHTGGGMGGFLVGGASLNVEDFTGIVEAVI
jgi:triosephosphate isomerase